MKRPVLILSLVSAVLCLFISTAYSATVDISIQNFSFLPSSKTINVGDTVKWTNNDSVAHTSTSGTGGAANGTWNSGSLSAGQSYSRTFNAEGTFDYFCSIHPSMTGTIIVAPLSGGTANLSVTKTGAGSGTVTSNPPGIACGAECAAVFAQGTSVTLTAKADANSAFDGWSGACTGKVRCRPVMSEDRDVTAAFKRKYYTITVSGSTNGKITPAGSGSPALVKVIPTLKKKFIISPKAGYYVSAITVDGATITDLAQYRIGSSRNYRYTFPLLTDDTHSIGATFTALPRLTITKSGNGTVTTKPVGSSCGKNCKQFDAGTAVTLTAKPAPKYVFSGWDGCTGDLQDPRKCTVTIDADTDVTATFVSASTASKGVAVDPYISGATFFEDLNNNGIKDEGEQVSTASDAKGGFSFSNPLTTGSTIIMDDKGTHNGVAYTGTLKRVVEASGDLITSPLTTLLANGWTTENVVNVLSAAGLSLTAEDLTKDPMSGIDQKDAETLSDADLEKIRASISVYAFLSIMDQVIQLAKTGEIPVEGLSDITSGYDLSYDKFALHPNWQVLLTAMGTLIKDGISKEVVSAIDSALSQATTTCTAFGLPAPPPATAGDVIRASVAISNYVVPRVVDSCKVLDTETGFPKCDYTPGPADYGNWRWELGEKFYILRTKGNGCISAGITNGLLPDVSGCKTFLVNAVSGEVDCSQ